MRPREGNLGAIDSPIGHSSEEAYVDLNTVEHRLYLLTRLVMDTVRGN